MFKNKNVVITGASRDFGVALAWNFASQGAKVFATSRKLSDAKKTCDVIREHFKEADIYPYQCDLTNVTEIRALASAVKEQVQSVDILIHNGSMWLQTPEFEDASDDDIFSVINSGTTGPILLTKYLLPLLKSSGSADIVNMVSKCAESGYVGDGPHEAFYAMKHGHAGFAAVMTPRLKKYGIRVVSLFPPDFQNTNPFSPEWGKWDPSEEKKLLNAKSLIDVINFSVLQPRSCNISKIYFEGNRR